MQHVVQGLRRTSRRAMSAGLAALAAGAVAPAAAGAVSVTVTGDDGAPVALGGSVSIRNMDPRVGVGPTSGEKELYTVTFVGPDGVDAAPTATCVTSLDRAVDFRGNGTYTVTVTRYGALDFSCTKAVLGTTRQQFAINASVALTAPAGRVLIRRPGSFATNDVVLPVTLDPGALTYEVRYARGGVVGPDGAISGPSSQGFVNTSTGTTTLGLRTAGAYTVVARAKGFSSATGSFFSPWSAPATVHAVSPFDFETTSFPDPRGPRYELAARLYERTARGQVAIAYAKGRRGGRFHSIGRARISRTGRITRRFTLHRTGLYRIRYRFAGCATTAGGTVLQLVRIRRTLVR